MSLEELCKKFDKRFGINHYYKTKILLYFVVIAGFIGFLFLITSIPDKFQQVTIFIAGLSVFFTIFTYLNNLSIHNLDDIKEVIDANNKTLINILGLIKQKRIKVKQRRKLKK